MNFREARQVLIALSSNENESPLRQEKPRRASEEGHENAFGQQKRDETSAVGAERKANGNLLTPRRGASEQEVRYIGAGDDEQQSDRKEQNYKCGANRSSQIPLQGDSIEGQRGIVYAGVPCFDTPREGCQFTVRGAS